MAADPGSGAGRTGPPSSRATAERLFAGPGEMCERCRTFDWAAIPLGPVEEWSQSLRTMAAAVLASQNPMLLFWGPDLVQIYNDAFRPSLGPSTGSDPRPLGMSAEEFWTDVWDVVGPQVAGVMERGEAVWLENLHLPRDSGHVPRHAMGHRARPDGADLRALRPGGRPVHASARGRRPGSRDQP